LGPFWVPVTMISTSECIKTLTFRLLVTH
jgi:hypothetical protein